MSLKLAVTGAVGIASGAIGMFGSYIEKSNPALMEQFGIILNDLGGVIGRSLAPVIQTLLPLFRQFADYIDYAMKLIQPSINNNLLYAVIESYTNKKRKSS